MDKNKSVLIAGVLVFLAIAAAVAYVAFGNGTPRLFSAPSGPPSGTIQESTTVVTKGTLDPQFQLTKEESRGDVVVRKAQILKRVRSGTPLSSAEKTEIGGIMFLKSEVYKFSDAERADIFKALNKK